MVNTTYSGSGFAGNKNITEDMAKQISGKISKFKETNEGKLTSENVHDLVRTAASDDGKVSQQEMDWINDALVSQGDIISKLNINEAKFGDAVQFTFDMSKKTGGDTKSFKSETIQGEAGKEVRKGHKQLSINETVGNIGEIKEKSLTSLSKLTQTMSKSQFSDNKCSASCLVAAAMYSKGREGLAKLADLTKAQAPSNLDLSFYNGLIDKLKDNSKPLTKEDVSNLQDMVYRVLKNKQDQKGVNVTGIHTQIIKDFTNIPEMKTLLGNDLKVRNVDYSGDGKADHFVLFIGETSKKPSVYDPWPKKDGKQVIDSPKGVETYRNAVSDS